MYAYICKYTLYMTCIDECILYICEYMHMHEYLQTYMCVYTCVCVHMHAFDTGDLVHVDGKLACKAQNQLARMGHPEAKSHRLLLMV